MDLWDHHLKPQYTGGGWKWPTAAALQKWGTFEDLCSCKLTFSFPTSFSDTEELQALFYLPFRLKWLQLLQVIFNGFNFQPCVQFSFFLYGGIINQLEWEGAFTESLKRLMWFKRTWHSWGILWNTVTENPVIVSELFSSIESLQTTGFSRFRLAAWCNQMQETLQEIQK